MRFTFLTMIKFILNPSFTIELFTKQNIVNKSKMLGDFNQLDIDEDKSFNKSYGVARTMKIMKNLEKAPTLNKTSIFMRNNTKSNTDFLYTKQLSEEMESTIMGIQPGGKASNYGKHTLYWIYFIMLENLNVLYLDKVSRNSSDVEKYRPNSNENNRMFENPINNGELSINFGPIGEHLPDEEQDNSTKFAGNFAYINIENSSKPEPDPPVVKIGETKSRLERLSFSMLNKQDRPFIIDANINRDLKITKIPTSSFNQDQSMESASMDESS